MCISIRFTTNDLPGLFIVVSIFLASNSIDMKARKRIEELFELTDEIINAYNEINDKYVSQIYRKYEQLKEVNKKLQDTLKRHHCTGCQCTTKSTTNEEEAEEEEDDESSSEEEEDESGDDDDDDDDDEQPTNSALPSSTTNSIVTRSKKNNRSLRIIPSASS